MPQYRKIFIVLFLFLISMSTGTLGFMTLEGWGFLDSLYMTTIILTTIGFKEVRDLSDGGRWFTIFFSISSLVLFTGFVSLMSSLILENFMSDRSRRKRMSQTIEKLKDHIILCGTGKIGRNAAVSLLKMKWPLVALDHAAFIHGCLEELQNHKEITKSFLYIEGDPTRENVLEAAGVGRARGLISCMPEDSQNLLIALSAKKMNPKILVSCYVMQEANIDKFYLVGADEIVSGDYVIGKKLAASLTHQNLASFMEQATNIAEDGGIGVNDVTVQPHSHLCGRTLRESHIYQKTGLQIFALKKVGSTKFLFNPNPDQPLESQDVLIFFGSEEDGRRLDSYLNKTRSQD